jgi:hypothetical protein
MPASGITGVKLSQPLNDRERVVWDSHKVDSIAVFYVVGSFQATRLQVFAAYNSQYALVGLTLDARWSGVDDGAEEGRSSPDAFLEELTATSAGGSGWRSLFVGYRERLASNGCLLVR